MFGKKVYNKLVRDKIPQIITDQGGVCKVERVDSDERCVKLLDKLLEEAAEVREAGCKAYLYSHDPGSQNDAFDSAKNEVIEELADIKEVIRNIEMWFDIQPATVDTVRIQKLKDKGGFDAGKVLKWVMK